MRGPRRHLFPCPPPRVMRWSSWSAGTPPSAACPPCPDRAGRRGGAQQRPDRPRRWRHARPGPPVAPPLAGPAGHRPHRPPRRRPPGRRLACVACYSGSYRLTDRPVADRLADAPRSGKPVRLTDAQVCQIIARACAAPARAAAPSASGPAARSPTRSWRAGLWTASPAAMLPACSPGGAPAAPLALLAAPLRRCRLRPQGRRHLHPLSAGACPRRAGRTGGEHR